MGRRVETVDEARAILAAVVKRQRERTYLAETAGVIRGLLFGQQSAFVTDTARRKAALCSRRAGKTFACGAYLFSEALRTPGVICVYIALSRKSARRLLWPVLNKLNDQHRIGAKPNNVELEMRLPNGSQIWLTGANDRSEIEKLRGDKYALVVLDECASFGDYLEELVEDVLEPATLDLDGTICMIGTPAAHCTGKFFDATTEPEQGWSVHTWTVLDNAHIPHARDWLARRMKAKGWDDKHPTYLREWRGQWVRSIDSMVYRYSDSLNAYTELPAESWEYVIGVDLGFEDATAFVVMAFSRDRDDVWVVDEFKRSNLIPADIAAQLREYVETYDPVRVVCDTGGLGKSIAEELKQRYALPIEPADKRGKLANIELLNGDLETGKLRARADSRLVSEWKTLQWDEDRRVEDSRFDNHLADAALYAYRECKHYVFEPSTTPTPGEADYHDRQARERERLRAEEMRRMHERERGGIEDFLR